jgi:hypothetical protein
MKNIRILFALLSLVSVICLMLGGIVDAENLDTTVITNIWSSLADGTRSKVIGFDFDGENVSNGIEYKLPTTINQVSQPKKMEIDGKDYQVIAEQAYISSKWYTYIHIFESITGANWLNQKYELAGKWNLRSTANGKILLSSSTDTDINDEKIIILSAVEWNLEKSQELVAVTDIKSAIVSDSGIIYVKTDKEIISYKLELDVWIGTVLYTSSNQHDAANTGIFLQDNSIITFFGNEIVIIDSQGQIRINVKTVENEIKKIDVGYNKISYWMSAGDVGVCDLETTVQKHSDANIANVQGMKIIDSSKACLVLDSSIYILDMLTMELQEVIIGVDIQSVGMLENIYVLGKNGNLYLISAETGVYVIKQTITGLKLTDKIPLYASLKQSASSSWCWREYQSTANKVLGEVSVVRNDTDGKILDLPYLFFNGLQGTARFNFAGLNITNANQWFYCEVQTDADPLRGTLFSILFDVELKNPLNPNTSKSLYLAYSAVNYNGNQSSPTYKYTGLGWYKTWPETQDGWKIIRINPSEDLKKMASDNEIVSIKTIYINEFKTGKYLKVRNMQFYPEINYYQGYDKSKEDEFLNARNNDKYYKQAEKYYEYDSQTKQLIKTIIKNYYRGIQIQSATFTSSNTIDTETAKKTTTDSRIWVNSEGKKTFSTTNTSIYKWNDTTGKYDILEGPSVYEAKDGDDVVMRKAYTPSSDTIPTNEYFKDGEVFRKTYVSSMSISGGTKYTHIIKDSNDNELRKVEESVYPYSREYTVYEKDDSDSEGQFSNKIMEEVDTFNKEESAIYNQFGSVADYVQIKSWNDYSVTRLYKEGKLDKIIKKKFLAHTKTAASFTEPAATKMLAEYLDANGVLQKRELIYNLFNEYGQLIRIVIKEFDVIGRLVKVTYKDCDPKWRNSAVYGYDSVTSVYEPDIPKNDLNSLLEDDLMELGWEGDRSFWYPDIAKGIDIKKENSEIDATRQILLVSKDDTSFYSPVFAKQAFILPRGAKADVTVGYNIREGAATIRYEWEKVNWNGNEPITQKSLLAEINDSSSVGYVENVQSLSIPDENGILWISIGADKAVEYFLVNFEVTNMPPVFEIIGNKTVSENNLLEFTVHAIDENVTDGNSNDKLVYSATGLPEGAVLDPSTGVFTWTPGYEQAGKYNITFKVVDSKGSFDTQMIVVTVNNVNRPPVISLIEAIEVNEGEKIDLSQLVSVSDPDGDSVEVTYSGWMNTSTYTTGYDDAGEHIVTIIATDGTDTVSQDVTIKVKGINRSPELVDIGSRSIEEGHELMFIVTATDPDNDILTYSASGLPVGAIFTDNSDGTSTFAWTPSVGKGTNVKIIFTVSDGELTDSEEVIIFITENTIKDEECTCYMANWSNIIASSVRDANYAVEKAIDGKWSIWDENEWASNHEMTPKIKFSADNVQIINKVVIRDRGNPIDQIIDAWLYLYKGKQEVRRIHLGIFPNSGAAKEIVFDAIEADEAELVVTNGVGLNIGISEFQAFYECPLHRPDQDNLALKAHVAASSSYNENYSAESAIDGKYGIWDESEWASKGEMTPHIQFIWDQPELMNKIILYGRSNPVDKILDSWLDLYEKGILIKSIHLEALPEGGAAQVVVFDEVYADAVILRVTDGVGLNIGLSEFKAYYDTNTQGVNNIAASCTVTASSYYKNDDNYGANMAIDGKFGAHDKYEWSSWGEMTPWIRFKWDVPQLMNKVVLYDRSNPIDQIKDGYLYFYKEVNGQRARVKSLHFGILGDGAAAKELLFDPIDADEVILVVTNGTGLNIGLSEFIASYEE